MRRIKVSVHALADTCVRVFAVFGVLSLVLDLMTSRWDGAWLWAHGSALPPWLASGLLLLFAVVLLFGRRVHASGGFVALCLGVLLAIACLADSISFFRSVGGVRIAGVSALPPSLFVAALLLLWVATAGGEPYSSESRTRRALWLRVVDRTSP